MRQRARRHTQATRLFSYVARWLGEGQEVLWRRLGERGTGPGAGLADRGPKEGGLWPTVTRGKEGAGGGGGSLPGEELWRRGERLLQRRNFAA